MEIYHNYVRLHEALNGKTSSEAAGIKGEGENKRITLMQNAEHKQKQKPSGSMRKEEQMTNTNTEREWNANDEINLV